MVYVINIFIRGKVNDQFEVYSKNLTKEKLLGFFDEQFDGDIDELETIFSSIENPDFDDFLIENEEITLEIYKLDVINLDN